MSRPATAASSSTTLHRPKKRKIQRVLLAGTLQTLGDLSTPLPPTLTAPRTHDLAQAAARPKRKLDDVATDEPQAKKPRTTPATPQPASSRPPVPLFPQSQSGTQAPALSATAPSDSPEDGEVRDGLPIYRNSIAVVSNVPVRRPRRRQVPPGYWEDMYSKYQAEGVRLRYSAKARIDSTYPSTDPRFRALPDPPPAGTAYHKFGHLMARLEYVDALLCFTYALWCIDIGNNACFRQNWPLVLKFVEQAKTQWRCDDGEDWERAFHGLICLVEAYIHGRKWRFNLQLTRTDSARLMQRLQICQDAEDDRRQLKEAQLEKQRAQQLPSPAPSAGSTPNGLEGTGTPNPATAQTTPAPSAPPQKKAQQPEQRERSSQINPAHTVSVNINTVGPYRSQAWGLYDAKRAVDVAGRLITLPIMAKHFPRTFARMAYSSLSTVDEHEPDFDDEEGELFWPGQVVGSEGLGWICYMGRAMVKEYAKPYRYKGVDGALPLPAGYHNSDDPRHFPLPQEPTTEAAAPAR
ncbi:uncharacterized protein C8Q71DRAFT_323986 [Rhodofomes roseus]|uniref:Uncharacterized protein n=1 Tax=Rhodofomes roseus TaxID=34475 RepID=A0ABQ8K288_9APHY|nr:uncharacterized protein C8Q71DRAFT_323986 [Rhodofomes roseus]KAH9830837.1 hypothetical protein C8Q71DRAFT_323986 [Rhodofomes roseus]